MKSTLLIVIALFSLALTEEKVARRLGSDGKTPIMKPNTPSIPIEYWPGESICVSCNLFGGLLVLSLEVAAVMVLIRQAEKFLKVQGSVTQENPDIQLYELKN